MFYNHIARIRSASASDRNIPAYGSFNIWWRNITKKKLSANLYSNRDIDFARVFSVALLNDYVRGNQFSEVVHDQSGKYLQGNVLHLFCVKSVFITNRSKREGKANSLIFCRCCINAELEAVC